jgi:peptidyl-tRNA hydrolase, PTH1 family
MKLIVGLGNPGERYSGTRHNIGAAVIREFCAENQLILKKGFFASSKCAKARFNSCEALVAIPLAYMNCSGPAVGSLVRKHRIAPIDLLVVHDDIDLEFGRIKARSGGSSGGHNGLKSVVASVGSPEFCRLRIGIGRPPGNLDPADFVLSRFTATEQKEINETVTQAGYALKVWLCDGISKTMNMFNR